jgi:two-component system chemotaxis sensor kinase CheA
MWLFDRLKVRLKLALLAGVPVLGALILSALIARDAQQRARTAEGLGSIEDLAQLTEQMTRVTSCLQLERARLAFNAGAANLEISAPTSEEGQTDRTLSALEGFVGRRARSQLPTKLRRDLSAARRGLSQLSEYRKKARKPEVQLDELLRFYADINDSLISATAALTQLSDDGELLLSISRLVSAMQVIERSSREHALLAYVFGKNEFPPGTFRDFVTLLTEQEAYKASFRTFESDSEFQRFQRVLEGSNHAKIEAMRKAALEMTEQASGVDAKDWLEVQQANMLGLFQVERQLTEAVRSAASKKVADTRHAIRIGIGLASAVLAVSSLLGWAIARSLMRSVKALSETAETVHQNGDFSVRAKKTSTDELGLLTDAFNGMLAGIQERDRELQRHRENLEALVEARTRELSQRNEQMRLVLDNVEQGLVMIDRQGMLLPEYSRRFAEAFGSPVPGTPFHDAIAKDDGRANCALDLAYQQLINDVFPLDLAIDQMPKTLTHRDRQYALSFTAVVREGKPDGALLVVRDITAEVAARRDEAIQREQLKVFERVLHDRQGFLEFLLDARGLVELIRNDAFASNIERMRTIHTLKGNSAVFDLNSVAEAAHEFERSLLDSDCDPGLARGALLSAWAACEAQIAPILGEAPSNRLEVTEQDLRRIVALVHSRGGHSSIERALLELRGEPARLRFERVEQQMKALARRLDKAEPLVQIDAGDVRLPVAHLRDFWSSFAHVVRNSVDHGLETPAERERAGKPSQNQVELRVCSDERALTIEIADDGRGIDWAKLATKAEKMNLAHGSRSELQQALFAAGVSTADEVSQHSGRGVGLSAVSAACTALGGTIRVDSEPGSGTRFRFVFPPIESRAESDDEQRPERTRRAATSRA